MQADQAAKPGTSETLLYLQQEVGEEVKLSTYSKVHVTLRVKTIHCKSTPCLDWYKHRSTATEDITYLICRVTSQSHMIEGSCKFLGGRLS